MSAREYWVGLPVGITVHDDGTIEVEVDMSEASSEMQEQWSESDEMDWSEPQMLLDVSVVDANPNRSSAASVRIAPAVAEMQCPARYACGFKTFERAAMAAHLTDRSELHGVEPVPGM